MNEVALLKADYSEGHKKITLLEQKLEVEEVGATIINMWEMIKKFKGGVAKDLNVWEAEEAYREVLVARTIMEGKTPLMFPESFTILEIPSRRRPMMMLHLHLKMPLRFYLKTSLHSLLKISLCFRLGTIGDILSFLALSCFKKPLIIYSCAFA